MKRRGFLIAAFAGAAAGAWSIARFLAGRAEPPPLPPPDPVFAPGSEPFLLAVADAVVPRVGDAPAASEIDLIPRLEHWVTSSPSRRRSYRRAWPRFEWRIRARTMGDGDRPDPEALTALLEQWYRDYREGRAHASARFFEQLRRDTLRVYYASPAGWISLGYMGPVQRVPFPAEPDL